MSNFNIPVTATTDEVAAAQYFLAKENDRITERNEDRAEQGLDPLPTYSNPIEFIAEHNQRMITMWLNRHNDALKQEVSDLWDEATDEERTAARTALGG